MRINQNIAAVNAYRNLTVTNGQMSKSLEKLSSGFRINRAADDAAGLAISEGLRSQIGGLKVGVRNAQDGISVVQTAEGALTEVQSLLQRVRDLAVQAASTGGNSAEARGAAATEVEQAMAEIDRISQATEFGGKKLLDGSETAGFTFHVGSGAGAENQVNVNIAAMSTTGLALGTTAAVTGTASTLTSANVGTTDLSGQTLTVSDGTNTSAAFTITDTTGVEGDLAGINAALTAAGINATATDSGGALVITSSSNDGATYSFGGTAAASLAGTAITGTTDTAAGLNLRDEVAAGNTSAITRVDSAIGAVSTQRANLGAYQNRLEHTIANLSVTMENLSASESRIRDTDMAQEMVSFTRAQILTQAGTAMLAQANQAPQGVLSLLR